MKLIIACFFFVNLLFFSSFAQTFSIKGKVSGMENEQELPHATIQLKDTDYFTITDTKGNYHIKNVTPGKYILYVSYVGYKESSKEIVLSDKDITVNLPLHTNVMEMDSVVVSGREKTFGITRLKDVEGTAIYAGKKTEVIVMNDITANTATNNTRQIYSKIAGLNIYESDGAGIQLGIGGRGLNPQRTSNFNTRQNGYDISADALGYPESYYSPPTEAIDRIEIVRGAASLQYGTQFGGLVNFKLKNGPADKKIQLTSRLTGGSWGFWNSFNSIGGTVKKITYYAYYQHKAGDGWRPNGQFNVNAAYGSLTYKANEKLSLTLQYTYMDYLAHQPGGLTDDEFAKDPRQSIRTRNWFKVNWNLGAAILDYKISNRLKLNSRFFGLMASRSALGVLDFINRPDPLTNRDLWTDSYNNWGNETRLLYNYTINKNPCALLIGFRYYSGYTDRKQGLGNDGSGGTPNDFAFNKPDSLEFSKYSFPNNNTSIFIENIFRITSKFSIIPGIRFENIQTRANGYYNIINFDKRHDIIYNQRVDEHRLNNRSFVIGGIGLSYDPNDVTQIYANISQNYRAINFNDMRVINPNLQVDPNLKDEKGFSADMGIRGSIPNILHYDVSLFMINYNNRIGTTLEKDTITFNTYRLRTNIAQSINVGVESFVELDIWRLIKGESAKMKVSVFSNFTILDARYINSKEPAFENKKVELVPNVIFKTGITVKRNKWAATYQFSYTGEQYTDATNAIKTDNAINGLIPAYSVMDLSVEYTFSKIFSAYGTINNLLNNMYFTRRADSYPGPGIIPSDARSFYLTLQVKI